MIIDNFVAFFLLWNFVVVSHLEELDFYREIEKENDVEQNDLSDFFLLLIKSAVFIEFPPQIA